MDNKIEHKIITIPNLISFTRFIFIPIVVLLLFKSNNIVATILYALIALTDFLDGFIARKTNSVTKLGKILDPAVDSFLMMTSIVSLYILARIPFWIFLFILLRYFILLIGGGILMKFFKVRVNVVYIGKIGSAFLCFGIAWVILNMPIAQGFDILPAPYFPGLCLGSYCIGFWFLYIGCIIAFFTFIFYILKGITLVTMHKS